MHAHYITKLGTRLSTCRTATGSLYM